MIVKPDRSEASLHTINTSIHTPHKFEKLGVCLQNYSSICEDTLVSLWGSFGNNECGVYTGLMSAHFTAIKHWSNSSLCPASGRFVYFTYDDDDDGRIVVVDLI